jgi:hypothetical protein
MNGTSNRRTSNNDRNYTVESFLRLSPASRIVGGTIAAETHDKAPVVVCEHGHTRSTRSLGSG